MGAVPLCATESLEKSYRYETTCIGQSWVAGFVPISVVLAPDNVEEVASRKAELLALLCLVIVQRTDDLQ